MVEEVFNFVNCCKDLKVHVIVVLTKHFRVVRIYIVVIKRRVIFLTFSHATFSV